MTASFPYPDYYYSYTYYGSGLMYMKDGKYGAVHRENTTDGKLYDTLWRATQGDYFNHYRENGKYGITDGKTVIPAVFDDTVRLSKPYVTARHGNVSHTQAFTQNGEQLYYDTNGKLHVSQNGSYDTRSFGKKMGL